MPLTVDKVEDVTVVTVNVDEFDASNADDFKQEVAPVLQTLFADRPGPEPGAVRGQQRLRRHPVVS